MNKKREKPRLESFYKDVLVPKLKKSLGLKNVMEVPKIEKIVLNVGIKEAVNDKKALKNVKDALTLISGQLAVETAAKKSIAGFKIREGLLIGSKVTLRNYKMYYFLDKLVNLVLPMIKDFRGIPKKFDKFGNYNLGIKEWTVFPEVDYDIANKIYGLNISIVIKNKNRNHSLHLLEEFGMPFIK